MKKFLIALFSVAFLVIGTQVAHAWWTAQARVSVTRARVQGSVYNRLPRPIYCRGNVYGELASGHVMNAWMSGTIYPNRYGYVYVYTNNPNNPFVRGWANIRCETR